MMVAESWMTDVAQSLGRPTEEVRIRRTIDEVTHDEFWQRPNSDSVFLQVRRLNLYMEGDSTSYNQILDQFTLDRCWDECLSRSGYQQRRAAVDLYNR